ncbi:MAG: ATP-binding protein [Phycisphaeraceae bacterium]|nr:ATP-binding protein [Phycisphaeraceae bacterium]
MVDYEKLGAFYLGRTHDLEQGRTTDDLLLYDAKDLTTHAVCVGMTGSGKTGLCVSLLEEAAIDRIPAIVIDPKGDLGNLLLTFPKLRPADFEPWVDAGAAQRKGMTPAAFAADRAALWKKGLAAWGQDGKRIARFRESVDLAIYTPGGSAGLPLTVLRSFGAPGREIVDNPDAFRERVATAVSGLLALVGIDADPIRSREHILLSNIIDRAWRQGKDVDLGTLIGLIQSPPFERVGVMDVESFFPAGDRFQLAMSLNGLLASPGFASWMEGEPLDVANLLYTAEGRPRLSILSIAHLDDAERMFFVTVLLNEVVAWMRSQPGTTSLRALLYMDEVFGYFPPTANPPSKRPMLTLLKQARAYGLGVVLATQNPVDLDYKGLSNAGTWLIGRLQTERDKLRVLEGLEGASVTAGAGFDRARMEATLAGLGSRVFLMNNVHDDAPVVFHTRWAMSYLRGPLTGQHIGSLMAQRRASGAAPAPSAPSGTSTSKAPAAPARGVESASQGPPPRPAEFRYVYLPVARSVPAGHALVYRPALVGLARLHYVRVAAKIDEWSDTGLLALLDSDASAEPWDGAGILGAAGVEFEKAPDARATFEPLPSATGRKGQRTRWSKAMVNYLYRTREQTIWHCRSLKRYSGLGEAERDFRVRLNDAVREKRDLAVEKLRKRYAPKLARLQERIRVAEQRVEKEKQQFRGQGVQAAISLGATVLGALFGRKMKSVGTVSRAGTTLRGIGRTAQQRGDITRARQTAASLRSQLEEMSARFEQDTEDARGMIDASTVEIDAIVVRPRKSDVSVRSFALAWAPYRVSPDGGTDPVFDL